MKIRNFTFLLWLIVLPVGWLLMNHEFGRITTVMDEVPLWLPAATVLLRASYLAVSTIILGASVIHTIDNLPSRK
jgi:hypothetical protein